MAARGFPHIVIDGAGRLGLADLGIAPTLLEVVIPSYLARFRPGSGYSGGRAA